jgi:hypothetical protein
MKLFDKKISFSATNWPYWLGGILLAILNIAIFMITDNPWGITTVFALIGARGVEILGIDISQWSYITDRIQDKQILSYLLTYQDAILNLGIIIGSLLSILLAYQFRIRGVCKWKRGLTAIIGGFLMGYGARIAGGCNIGAMVAGVSSMSLHGWIFTIFIFLGVYIGTKLIRKIML